jgi:hypothetical protein
MELNHPWSPVAPIFQAGRRTRGGMLDVKGGHGIEPSALSGPSRFQDASRRQAPPARGFEVVPQARLERARPARDSRF